MRNRASASLFERARPVMPGGVSSPVRYYPPFPVFARSAKGCKLEDVDGNEYIDYCMGFGPLILGHAHPKVVRALAEQAERGTLYGLPVEAEAQLAEAIHRYYPSMEMVRFVSSGTEATMHALRLARGLSGKKKIVKIEGAFHGAHDSVLVKAGSGAATHSVPDSSGVPEEVAANTLLAPFNDLEAMAGLLRSNKGEVAAVIAEPVMGNIGPVLPEEGYLQGLRELCDDHGVLLVLDEVITGFRLAMGGAQERYGIRADITTLGKIVGGGMPMGVFGASTEIMSQVSPLGRVYQAGTFSGNPMSLAAGIATVEALQNEGHEALESLGDRMRRGLKRTCAELDLDYQVQGIGSIFQLLLTPQKVTDYATAMRCDGPRFMRLIHALLGEGVYLPPSQWESCFLSTAHSRKEVDRTVEAFAAALAKVMAG